MYLVQIWVTPGIRISAPIGIAITPPVTIKTVEVKPPDKPKFIATLLETTATEGDSLKIPEKEMRHLERVLSRLSFCFLVPFRVFSARVVPEGLKKGDKYEGGFSQVLHLASLYLKAKLVLTDRYHLTHPFLQVNYLPK